MKRLPVVIFGMAIMIVPAAAAGLIGWRVCGAYGERCELAGRFYPSYSAAGKIELVMYDLTGNGIVETWVHKKDNERIELIEIDRDEDGLIDRRMRPDDHAGWRVEIDAKSRQDLR